MTCTLSVFNNKLRSRGNYFDLLNQDGYASVTCMAGLYKSYSESIITSQRYTTVTFSEALKIAFTDFRSSYRKKLSKEYEGENEAVINSFAQVYLDPAGLIHTFTYGGSQIGLLRNKKLFPLDAAGTECCDGDIIFVNQEGESSAQKRMEGGDFTLEGNDYPVLILKVEKQLVKSAPSFISAKSPESGEKLDSYKSKLNIQYVGFTVLFLLAAAGAWYGYKNIEIFHLATSPADSILQVRTQVVSNDKQPGSEFPSTDRILEDYYNSKTRKIPTLDKAILQLGKEKNRNPEAADAKLKDLVIERNALIKKISDRFYEHLRDAQVSLEDGRVSEAENNLLNAGNYLNDNFSDDLAIDKTVLAMRLELKMRKERLMKFKESGF